MIPALGRFVDALRREGIRPSPGEVLDAARAVDAVGVESRPRFRAALRATLLKDTSRREDFDRLFDRFFAPPARSGRERGESGGAGIGGQRRSGASERPGAREPVEREPSARRPGEPRHARERPSDRAGARETPSPQRRDAERVSAAEPAGRPGRLRKRIVERRREGERSGAPERAPASARAAADDPLRRDLTRPMPTEEERRLARLVPRLIEEIRLRRSRRARRSTRGRIWTRRIFRENLSRGGVPFVLPLRSPRPRRPRVVLLVDVSFSTARAAGYFLWMAAAFLQLGRHARVIAFVDRPVDITRPIARWSSSARAHSAFDPITSNAETGSSGAEGIRTKSRMSPPGPIPARRARRPGQGIAPRGDRSFADLLETVPGLNLQALSDYGRAFHALLQSSLRPSGRDTVLVVLGDGRTNRFDPLPWALEEIAARCRTVLWLVPEPASRWGTGDSALHRYLPHVDVAVEARDLLGLARGLRELLRSL